MNNKSEMKVNYSNLQLTSLVILRMMIGWHFLYEGLIKLMNPLWSSAGFLGDSKWIFSGFFNALAANQTVLSVVDFLNIWGLIAIGIGLIAGLFTKTATYSGMILLITYFLCTPPFIGLTYSIPTEGSYLLINKVIIEAAALFVLAIFPTGNEIGLDRYCSLLKNKKNEEAVN